MRETSINRYFWKQAPNLPLLQKEDDYVLLTGGVAKINEPRACMHFMQWAVTLQKLEAARQTVSAGSK